MKFKIFVINLNHSVERLSRISARLSALGLNYERCEAVNGELIDDETRKKIAPDKANKRHYFRRLNKGEIGVALSHRKCWEEIIEQKLDFAIILEDDAVIDNNFVDALLTLSKLSMSSWHMIRLYLGNKDLTTNTLDQFTFKNFDFVLHKKIPLGMVAQAVSQNGAHTLLENYHTIDQPIDSKFKRWWELGIMQPITLTPCPVTIDNSQPSTIDSIEPVSSIQQFKWTKLMLKIDLAVHRLIMLKIARGQFSHFKQLNGSLLNANQKK